LRAAAFAVFTSVFIFSAAAPAPTSAAPAPVKAATPAASPSTTLSPAARVISIAKSKLGAPWVHYAIGPYSFDCSGLVYYAFKTAGYASKIGGRMSAAGYYSYFRKRGLASTTNPRLGDLVVWGGGSHIGIYIGNGYAISTLTSGVRIHKVHAVTAPFTAYLHTGMSGGTVATATTTTASTSTVAATGVRYTTTRLNLRTGPGTRYQILRVLPTNARLTVLARGRDSLGRTWYKVQRFSSVGWVAGWFTRTTPISS